VVGTHHLEREESEVFAVRKVLTGAQHRHLADDMLDAGEPLNTAA